MWKEPFKSSSPPCHRGYGAVGSDIYGSGVTEYVVEGIRWDGVFMFSFRVLDDGNDVVVRFGGQTSSVTSLVGVFWAIPRHFLDEWTVMVEIC
jgi:hypothetical protein